MLLDVQHVEFEPNCVKVCEECVRVCEGVHEGVWKYHKWGFQFENMHLDIQYVEFGPKLAKIEQSVKTVQRVCESF